MKLRFAIFLSLIFAAPLLSAQTITPGIWKASTVIKLNAIVLPPLDVKDCISAGEAKDIKKYIQENLMPDTQCTITKWDYKSPNLKVSLVCKNSQYDSKGELTGKVTDKSFEIAGTLQGEHVLMGEVKVGIDYKGTYTKPCK